MFTVSLKVQTKARIYGTILVFLHAYNETSWDDQLTKESLVERTVRAVNHARRTLMAGFTTVR